MKLLGGAALVAALIVLSGCSSDLQSGSLEIPTDSVPAFLAEPQQDVDIPVVDVSEMGIAPESTRYQGEVEGILIYLGVQGSISVYVVQVDEEDPESWAAGTANDNGVLGFSPMVTGIEMQYLPQGTADLPDGWEAFSPWVSIES